MCADFAAHRAVQQRVPLDRASVTRCSSLVHGSGRLFPTPLTQLDRRARGTRPQDSQDKQKTNEFKEKPSGSPEGEYLSAGKKAPDQHPQHGVEGRAPHRAEASRKPQGTNRGGGQDKRGDAARRKRANPKQPQTTQEKRTKQQRETQTTPSKGQDTPATPQDTNRKAHKPNNNRRTRTDRAGR